jgi:hypothetical protein
MLYYYQSLIWRDKYSVKIHDSPTFCDYLENCSNNFRAYCIAGEVFNLALGEFGIYRSLN